MLKAQQVKKIDIQKNKEFYPHEILCFFQENVNNSIHFKNHQNSFTYPCSILSMFRPKLFFK